MKSRPDRQSPSNKVSLLYAIMSILQGIRYRIIFIGLTFYKTSIYSSDLCLQYIYSQIFVLHTRLEVYLFVYGYIIMEFVIFN